MTVIYLFGISAYNLWGDNDYLIWRFMYFFLNSLILCFAFYALNKKSSGKVRTMYFVGLIFSCFYALFELFALTSGSIAEYLGKVNSKLWGTISFILILLLLIYVLYDKDSKRKVT